MRISVAALAAMFAADPVAAYCTETPYVSSTTDVYTTVHGPLSSFDFDQSGAPATSSRSDNAQNVDLSYNFSVSSALTQSFGSFDIDTSVGGNTDIVDITSYGASAGAVGDLGDCLTFGGHVGTGRAHIPLHLTGGAAIGWTITGQYVPPPSVNPAEVQFRILCFVTDAAGYGNCPDLELRWTASETLDTTFDVTFAFTFGAPIELVLEARVGSSVGYAANGSPGYLDGFANVALGGALQPLTVTDGGGTPLAGVTLVSESGYDYLPEPGAALAAGAALTALALRARCRQTFAMTRSA